MNKPGDEVMSMAFPGVPPQVKVYRENNNIYFYDEMNPETVYYMEKFMREIRDTSRAPYINLLIDSFGGHPCSSYDYIKNFEVPVLGFVRGYCCSGATTLLLACAKKFMAPSSLMLIHSYQGPGDDWQKQGTIKDDLENITRQNNLLKKIYKENTKIPPKLLDELLNDRERFLTAEECLKYKIIDAIGVCP
jgi:ATP-dependent protease ClpP protease subunit